MCSGQDPRGEPLQGFIVKDSQVPFPEAVLQGRGESSQMEQQTPAAARGTRGFEIAFSSSGEGRSTDKALAAAGSVYQNFRKGFVHVWKCATLCVFEANHLSRESSKLEKQIS